ncbi:MAG TPA: SDR family oxidoreductase [Fibrobacteria bacterium]|jgi:uncharacterized protein YbjT (DUF2867 family)|nr:SDR family oxidoreductase [Fibrobacteria bacterium]
MSQQILVVGASGKVGSELVKLLKSQGHAVRVTTGKPASGTDAVQVDLATGAGLDAAFAGIERAFFLSPGGYADQLKVLSPLIAKAKANGLKKVVLMTAIGVDMNPEAPLRKAELELEASGVPFNIIRPQWFMQNFNSFWVQGIKDAGRIDLPAGDGKAAFIDARDIAAVAAKLLTDDSRNGQAFTLTGPELLTHADVAKILSETLGKPVTFHDTTPEDLRKTLLSWGVPADYTELLVTLLGFLKAGYTAVQNDSVKQILGREPGDFRTYAKDFAASWK